MTPLCLAVRKGVVDVVKLLLKNGASMRDILAHDWRQAYVKDDPRAVLLLSMGAANGDCVRLINPVWDQLPAKRGIARRLW